MALGGQVHWHEGLFLQPHHLQSMQKDVFDRIGAERALAWSYPYGLIEARLSADALENMQLQFDRLRVITKSGQEVSFPTNADLPAREFKHELESSSGSLNVYLGVPLWYATRANTVDPAVGAAAGVKRIYRTEPVERPDENTGENAQTVMVRRLNAMILFDTDDHSDLEVLPLLRITHGVGEEVGTARLDPSFVPACLVLSGSPSMRELVRDLAHQVDASRKELLVQLTRGGFSLDTMRGRQFEQIMRLRTLNRYAGRLLQLVAAPAISPLTMYLELRSLLGELAALHPDRNLYDVPDYDHDNPVVAFKELSSNIRPLLKGAVTAAYDHLKFALEDRILVGTPTEEQLTRPNQYFLGVKTASDPRAVATVVEDGDKFKLMAKGMIQSRSYGIKLTEERHPPVELPSHVNLHYFRLDRAASPRMWERIVRDKVMAIRWPEMELSDYEITLYMTVPEGAN